MSFIQTLSGKQFDYLSATIDDIDIEDIAVALSIFAASPDIFLNFIAWRSIPYCAASLYHRSLPLKP